MGPMEAIMSGVTTIFYFAMVVAVVWKIFQIATDLSQIKAQLIEMRQTQPVPAPRPVATAPAPPTPVQAQPPILAGPISLESAEALLREIEAESHALAAAERPQTTA